MVGGALGSHLLPWLGRGGAAADPLPGQAPTPLPHHTCANPPSTASSVPVMNDASGEARNPAALATSWAAPNLPSGTRAATSFRNASRSWAERPVFSKIGVSIGPGLKIGRASCRERV